MNSLKSSSPVRWATGWCWQALLSYRSWLCFCLTQRCVNIRDCELDYSWTVSPRSRHSHWLPLKNLESQPCIDWTDCCVSTLIPNTKAQDEVIVLVGTIIPPPPCNNDRSICKSSLSQTYLGFDHFVIRGSSEELFSGARFGFFQ